MQISDDGLALPVLAMLVLTLLVWLYLFVQRIGYARAQGIDIESFKTPGDTAALIPGPKATASNNFQNLLEMPLVFYTICFYLTIFGRVDDMHVTCAWIFVLFRVLHSVIHCTFNRVSLRFMVYLVSSIAVWVMVVRAFLSAM
jgi:hypothetical protein